MQHRHSLIKIVTVSVFVHNKVVQLSVRFSPPATDHARKKLAITRSSALLFSHLDGPLAALSKAKQESALSFEFTTAIIAGIV
jgi:hypothetical protein